MVLRIFLACTFALWAAAAAALPVDWAKTISASASAGPENPLVLFGFNPQPEPPAAEFNNSLDPTQAIRQVLGVEPTPFRTYLALSGATFSSGFMPVDAVGVPGLLGLSANITTDLGQDLTIELRFLRNGSASLIDADALFFNPQPEPPALWNGGMLGADISFASDLVLFSDDDEGETFGAVLEIRDAAGGPLGLRAGPPVAPVPLPASLGLLGGALFGLGALRASLRDQRAG